MNFRSGHIKVCLTLLIVNVANSLIAQEKEFDKSIVFNWRFIGVDPDTRSQIGEELNQGLKNFVDSNLQDTETLEDFLQKKHPTIKLNINAKKFYKDAWVFTSPDKQIIEPTLCDNGSSFLIIINRHEIDTGLHFGLDHFEIAKAELLSELPSAELATKVGSMLNNINQSLNQNYTPRQSNSVLKLAAHLQRETSGQTTGSSYCYNQLFVQIFQNEFKFISQIDQEKFSFLNRTFPKTFKMNRSNRSLSFVWDIKTSSDENSKSLTFKILKSESVFGKKLSGINNNEVTLALNNISTMKRTDFSQIGESLMKQQVNLETQVLPKIVNRDRSWVFLDKGRAWGLTMDARLVVPSNSEIKGHVVGFYGPEMKLKNSNDEIVNEGAIVYIREGQDKVSVGMDLAFDPRQFP